MLTRRLQLALMPQLGDLLGRLSGGKKDSGRTALGLKEALSIGLVNAVGLAEKPDGYFANNLIKILLPEKLRNAEKALQVVGFGNLTDNFVMGMNRAAEKAAPAAKQIFLDSLKTLTIQDALQIFRGGDTAATQYFERSTTPQLTAAFRPVIGESLQSVGAIQAYEQFLGRFKKIPFARVEAFDVTDYTTSKAIGGLFLLVGNEEKQIRQNPAARVTPLLKEIFGGKA